MFRIALSLLVLAVAAQGGRVSRLPESVWRNNPQLRMWKDERIVGGDEVPPHSLPYQVSLQYPAFNFHFCGGSVYNQKYILTAAHCCDGQRPSDMRVNAGEHSLGSNDGTEQMRNVVRIKMHESYSATTVANDICLLEMDAPLSYDYAVDTITVAAPGETFSGKALVSGWGTLYSGGPSPDALRAVEIPLVSDSDCRAAYGYFQIKDSMICAGEGGKDSCQGDSGGPLKCEGDKLCGIVSWGYGCADPDYPGVLTEVSYYNDWLITNAGAQY